MSISIRHLFGRKPKSNSIAKQRLQLVITQDRSEIDNSTNTRLLYELTEVLAKYYEFSMNSVQMSLKQEGNSYVLVADFPHHGTHNLKGN